MVWLSTLHQKLASTVRSWWGYVTNIAYMTGKCGNAGSRIEVHAILVFPHSQYVTLSRKANDKEWKASVSFFTLPPCGGISLVIVTPSHILLHSNASSHYVRPPPWTLLFFWTSWITIATPLLLLSLVNFYADYSVVQLLRQLFHKTIGFIFRIVGQR